MTNIATRPKGFSILVLSMIAVAVTAIHFSCGNTSDRLSGEVAIQDVRKTSMPEAQLASHKPHDFEAYRNVFMAELYTVRYYQMEGGKLNSHQASYELPDDFDRAAYQWTNDTTITVRLLNSATKKEKTFVVFGNASSSGIRPE